VDNKTELIKLQINLINLNILKYFIKIENKVIFIINFLNFEKNVNNFKKEDFNNSFVVILSSSSSFFRSFNVLEEDNSLNFSTHSVFVKFSGLINTNPSQAKFGILIIGSIVIIITINIKFNKFINMYLI
jgi:hypothetical protein